jgi:hypothetical protein
LKDLSLLDLDFSLEVTGFEMAEIDLRIEGLNSEPEGDDPADALPEAQSRTAVTRPRVLHFGSVRRNRIDESPPPAPS